jgi:integrase
MPQRSLTDRFCQHAKARAGDAQTDYFDDATPGLALRVTAAGSRTWTFLSNLHGKRVRMTFGSYPATSLAGARTKADEARHELEARRDPRAAQRSANRTIDAMLDQYAELRLDRSDLRGVARIKGAFARHVRPEIGAIGVYDIRRSHVVDMLDRIEAKAGPVMADRTLAYFRKACNWFATRDDQFVPPIIKGMARTVARDRARTRTLADDEIRDLWAALDKAAVPACYPALIRFLLLTASRGAEGAGLHKHELEADAIWTIPGERYKTKLDHVVPLSAAAAGLVGERAKLTGYAFSTTEGTKPFSGFSKAQRPRPHR